MEGFAREKVLVTIKHSLSRLLNQSTLRVRRLGPLMVRFMCVAEIIARNGGYYWLESNQINKMNQLARQELNSSIWTFYWTLKDGWRQVD